VRLLTPVEGLIGLAVITAIALGVYPQIKRAQFAIQRAEVPWYLEELKEAEFAHARTQGHYLAVATQPQATDEVGPHALTWEGVEGWWQPPRSITRGAYDVKLTDGGFEITGTCDVDGDGIRAVFRVTDRAPLERLTPDHVY
jgi:hypothetical protein